MLEQLVNNNTLKHYNLFMYLNFSIDPLIQAQNFGKAIGNMSRQIIIEKLFDGPATGIQIMEFSNLSQSLVSQQLKILKNYGLVVSTKQGQETLYEINILVFDDFVKILDTEIKLYKKTFSKTTPIPLLTYQVLEFNAVHNLSSKLVWL